VLQQLALGDHEVRELGVADSAALRADEAIRS